MAMYANTAILDFRDSKKLLDIW